jgi:hypothetical protein
MAKRRNKDDVYHEENLLAQGLRPIRIWVPDITAPSFVEEARRQSRLVAESERAAEDQAFVEAISEIKF